MAETRARDLADLGGDATGLATDAELSSGLASKLPYSYGTATPSTTDSGYLWYDSNSTPAAPKFWDGAAFQALTSGKILQVVRATDSTVRTTTSTSFVDVTGMSVTITPQKSDSAIIVIASIYALAFRSSGIGCRAIFQLTDNSNNALSGAEYLIHGSYRYSYGASAIHDGSVTLFGYSTPATTSATTYKMRFRAQESTNTAQCSNDSQTGQLYAIEVSA